jgi:hypothetical protein
MSSTPDAWFLRFPDGRVMRAASTEAVRFHLENGRIPPESRARRDPAEPWVALGRTPAFADLIRPGRRDAHPAHGPNAHNGGHRNQHEPLQHVGARGVFEELLTALDSTLVPGKLRVAVRTGVALGLIALFFLAARHLLPEAWTLLAGIVAVVLGLLAVSYCVATLTQMTFIELSRLRPSTRDEARAGRGRNALRLFEGALLVVGGLLAALYLLGRVPERLTPLDVPVLDDGLSASVAVVRLLLAVLVWPVLGLSLLLGPTVVIEEAPLGQSLRLWGGLIRQHLVRILLYETLAAAVAFFLSSPFLVAIGLAVWIAPGTGAVAQAVEYAAAFLLGLAVVPALAYLTVANVFIYLNLRYEQASTR